ncbi:MAG: tetratricopeptide repeat protein [Pyrinomonadaceae bacterium]
MLRKGEFEKAEKSFRETLAKDPRSFRARLGLSASLLKQRKIQDAFEQAARATTLDATSARARSRWAQRCWPPATFRFQLNNFAPRFFLIRMKRWPSQGWR